jgi:hypothetical protein
MSRNRSGKITIKLDRQEIEIDRERVLANDIVLPWESYPRQHNLWLIGNEYGALCAVWADNEQEALDECVDKGLLDSFLIDTNDKEYDAQADTYLGQEVTHLGNAGEPADLSYAWMKPVNLKQQSVELLCLFAEARGANADTLDF